MGSDRERLERAIEEAYREQTDSSPSAHGDVAAQVIKRGRRRRSGQIMGALGLVAVLATGAVAAVDNWPHHVKQIDPADAPAFGAERVVASGGPLAGFGDHLFIGSGRFSNDSGDKQSVARLDVHTGKVSETDPVATVNALNVAAGPEGLWLVGWSGDMPSGGDGGDVNGSIQLVDPVSGELLVDLPREDSAPYDVATATSLTDTAWVVDSARNELLRVSARSGAVEEIAQLGQGPNTVALGDDAVWVGANGSRGRDGALYRWDLQRETLETFPVDHCLNDLYVLKDSVWAVDYCGGAVHGFDAASGERLSTVNVGGQPTAMTFADGYFWVTRGNEVVRVDPASAEVVGEPVFVAEGVEHIAAVEDTVYVSSWEGVFRLGEDAPVRKPKPTPTEEEEPPAGGTSAEGCDHDRVTCVELDRPWSEVATGFGSAWVANIGEGKTFGIARFDSASGDETARLHTDGFVTAMAPDADHMWVLLEQGDDSVVQRIDPATTEVVDSYEIGARGNIAEPSLAVGDGFVWVSGPDGSLTRLTAATGQTETTSYRDQLPGYRVDSGPLHLAFGEGRLWVSYGKGHVAAVDPATGEITSLLRNALGVNAYEIALAAGQVWSPHQSVGGKNVVSYAATSQHGARGEVELPPGNPNKIVSEGERLWVLQASFDADQSEPGWLAEIDPIDHEVVGEPLSLELGFEGDLASGDGYVWVTGNNVLYRIHSN